jgi:hypothetical protein
MANLTPLTETIAAELVAQKRIGMWNGVGALCESPSQVRAAKQTIRSVLRKKTDRITFPATTHSGKSSKDLRLHWTPKGILAHQENILHFEFKNAGAQTEIVLQ